MNFPEPSTSTNQGEAVTVDRSLIAKVLALLALIVAFVVALVGFELVTTDNPHVLGWCAAAVVLLALAVLL